MSSAVGLRLMAVGAFGLAILLPPTSAVVTALAGAGLLGVSLARPSGQLRPRLFALMAGGLAALILLLGLDRGATGFPEPAGVMPAVVGFGTLTMVALVALARPASSRLAVAIAAAAFLIVSIEVMVTFGGNLYGLDVYRSHEAAADALRAGENPYTDAVTVVDGSPNAEPGDLIEGYSYPPVTLLGYTLGDLVGGDPRWTSATAMLGVVGVIVWLARRRTDVGAAVLLLLFSVPLQRAIIWSGWTEPLSLILLVLGVMLWRREWLSPVLLGLALASKQYLVVLVPLLVLIDSKPWRRSMISLGTAALTLLPAVIADFSAFWFTMVTRPLGLGFRPDTRSLSGAIAQLGVTFEVPSWLMLVLVTGLSVWLASRVATRSDLLVAVSVVLAATFLLSLAFTNYWWLVQWTAAVSAVIAVGDGASEPIRSGVSPSV